MDSYEALISLIEDSGTAWFAAAANDIIYNDNVWRADTYRIFERIIKYGINSRIIHEGKVVCSEENNPPDMIDDNKARMDIYINKSPSLNTPEHLRFKWSDKGLEYSRLPFNVLAPFQ
jgi:hypothetical protein